MHLNSDCTSKSVKLNDALHITDMLKNNLPSRQWLFKPVKIPCWFISDIATHASANWNNTLFDHVEDSLDFESTYMYMKKKYSKKNAAEH